jgi:prephenate dehydrogenase
MTIAVIGIGLIGGSLMVDLRKRGFADKIIGVDTNMHHQNIALLCGLVDENDTMENAIEKSDLIILATPVNTNCIMLPGILDIIAGTSKIVTDMGSTKAGQGSLCCSSSNGWY